MPSNGNIASWRVLRDLSSSVVSARHIGVEPSGQTHIAREREISGTELVLSLLMDDLCATFALHLS